MCFGSKPAPPPPPPPLPPAAPPPPPPVAPPKPPEPLQNTQYEAGVKTKQSKRDAAGITSKGTSSLRIPLNNGTNSSGGLNL